MHSRKAILFDSLISVIPVETAEIILRRDGAKLPVNGSIVSRFLWYRERRCRIIKVESGNAYLEVCPWKGQRIPWGEA
jgi:hypothetical protein